VSVSGDPGASIAVRRARAEDEAALRGLWRELDALHARLQPGFFRAGARAPASLAAVLADPSRALLVADADGVVAGALEVRLYDTPRHPQQLPRRRAYVEDLAVIAARRRRGIGRALMEAAAEWARARGAEELLLTVWAGNRAAAAFYERLGYRAVSRLLGCPL
jgi:ribosomal protein S18 acetylase RimI-like enzyme